MIQLRRRRRKKRGVEEFPCADGTTKRVNHDVDQEFALFFGEHQAKYDATVDLLKQAKVNGSREASARLSNLSFQLDEVNRSLMLSFRTLYALYATDPCSMHARFVAGVEDLVQSEQHARFFYGTLDRVIRSIEAGTPSEQAFGLLDQVGPSLQLSAPVTDQKMRDGAQLIDRWARIDGDEEPGR